MSLDMCFTKQVAIKQWEGWKCFVCPASFACFACCLGRTFHNVSFFYQSCCIYVPRCLANRCVHQLTHASLHFRPYKGKKTPLLRKHSKCSGPQRCHFYLFLFIFLYVTMLDMLCLVAVKYS